MTTRPVLTTIAAASMLLITTAACGQPRFDPLPPLEGPVPPTGETPPAEGWKPVTVVSGLEHPWGIAWLPDGSALITERPGRIRLLKPDQTLHPEPINGVPEVLALRQGGLLDIILHPDFDENRFVYIAYAHGTARANHTRIARARYEDHALNDLEVLFTTQPAKPQGFHFGCRMVFLPDNSLLFTMGEGGLKDPSQDMGSHLGKILRIMDDGSPATDNPFQARVDAAQEIYSYGHRNPQGLAIRPETGQIYSTEHGPRGGDELNLIEPGNNYGWPVVTYGYEYHGPRVSDQTSKPGMVDPLINWTPSIAASGLAFYTGDKFPEWRGNLFAGGLILKQVRRVIFDGDEIMGEETLQFDQRIRDVRDGPDGYLYVLTDERNGQLIRIEPKAD
ncbi:MAG: PQQ-dependent sugar dehydrogenase [Planctomycetes bacterium]|nr:PQQ-dependent sugar dehydrogenase [Planctomycetota bacterium]